MAEFIQYSDFFGPGTDKKFQEYLQSLGDIAKKETAKIIADIQSMAKGVNNELSASNIKAQANLTTAIDNGKKKIAEINEVEKERIRLANEFEKLNAKLNTGSSQAALNNEKLKVQIQEQNRERKIEAKLLNEAVGSYNRIALELNKNIANYKKLTTEQRLNADVGGKLLNTIQNQQNTLKKMDASMGNFQRNVGNYKSALEALPGRMGMVAASAEGMLSKVAKINPVFGLIGLAISAIYAPLKAFFTKSQEGVEMLERKMEGLKASWAVLVGELIRGGEKMTKSLDDPVKQSTMWSKMMHALGLAMGPAFMAKLTELGAKMDNANVTAQEYTRSLQELEKAEIALLVPRAQATQGIIAARLQTQNMTISVKERILALRQALELEKQQSSEEVTHQKEVVEQIKEVNQLKKEAGTLDAHNHEDSRKLAEAQAKLIELQTESMSRSRRAISALTSAENDEIAREISLTGDLTDKWLKLQEQIFAANKIGLTDRANQLIKEQQEVEKLQNDYNNITASLIRADQMLQAQKTNGFIPIDTLVEEQKNLEGVNKDLKEMNDSLPYMRDNTDEVTDGLKAMVNETKESDKEIQQLFSALQDLRNATFDLLSSINDANLTNAQMALDAEDTIIDGIKSRLDVEKKLKDEGSANDYDRLVGQLAKEQKVRDDQQKKYEMYQKRQAQLKFIETQANLGLSVSEAFVEGNKTGPYGFIIAIAAAAATIAAFINMQNQIKSIGKYEKGTEYLQRGSNPKGKDTIPVLANEGERIVPTDINSKLDGIDNAKLPEIYRFYKYNMLKGSGAVQASATSEVVRELKRGRNISEKMLNHFEDTPTAILLSDGRIMLKYGKFKTQIVTVSKS
jgi:hypothetical protein